MSPRDDASTPSPSRPVVRWFGGKWRLAPWIIEHLPPHRAYVEPFGGGGSVLLRKPRSYAEVYNDLDVEVVNLFRILRDDSLSARLVRLLQLTPFAREEFAESYGASDDPVERARRLVVLSFMGFGSNAHAKRSTGFRSNSTAAARRRRAIGLIIPRRAYRHEMNDDDHVALLAFLRTLKGAVVLSGYPHPLYDDALGDWHRVERSAYADGARDRTEVLWINQAARARMPAPMLL